MIILISCAGKPQIYETGDTVRPLVLKNSNNDEAALKQGDFNVILYLKFFDEGITMVRYVNDIYLKKYKDSGLNIFLITNSINKSSDSIKKEHNLSYPVLPINKNIKTLRQFFDTEDNDRAFVIINRDMILESTYYYFAENDIRQLLEKYLIGTITYSSEIKIDKMEVGETFPGITITQLNGKQENQVANTSEKAPHLWFMFSSQCVTCALKNYLLQYKLLEDTIPAKIKIPVALLFSHYFRKEQISEQIKNLKISAAVYLANEEIKGFESGYYKDASLDSIVVVLTGKTNDIVYLESFPDFVMQFTGGDFDRIFSNL
jgi:hypothetical protein